MIGSKTKHKHLIQYAKARMKIIDYALMGYVFEVWREGPLPIRIDALNQTDLDRQIIWRSPLENSGWFTIVHDAHTAVQYLRNFYQKKRYLTPEMLDIADNGGDIGQIDQKPPGPLFDHSDRQSHNGRKRRK